MSSGKKIYFAATMRVYVILFTLLMSSPNRMKNLKEGVLSMYRCSPLPRVTSTSMQIGLKKNLTVRNFFVLVLRVTGVRQTDVECM